MKTSKELLDELMFAFNDMSCLCANNLPDDPGWQDYVDDCEEQYISSTEAFSKAYDELKKRLEKSSATD